jgi:hypothetical protein
MCDKFDAGIAPSRLISMKTMFLKAAGFGVGFAATIIAAVGLFAYVISLPRPEQKWNETAVTSSFADLTFSTGDSPVINFSFTLENTTDHDYSLSNEKDSLYVELPGGKGLYQYNNSPDPYLKNITIDQSVIPSKQRVIVTLHLIYEYNDFYPKTDQENTDKMKNFMDKRPRKN